MSEKMKRAIESVTLTTLRQGIEEAGESNSVPLFKPFAMRLAEHIATLEAENADLRRTLDIGTRTIGKLQDIQRGLPR